MKISKEVMKFLIDSNIENKKILEEKFKYKIFNIHPNSSYYTGKEEITAKDIDEVREILNRYKSFDKDLSKDTDIYGKIEETDIFTDIWGDNFENEEDFIEDYYNGIRYVG